MQRIPFVLLLLALACSEKKANKYIVEVRDTFRTPIPMEFSTFLSTAYICEDKVFVTNASNKLLVLEDMHLLRDSLLEFQDFEVSDLSVLSFNPFDDAIYGHSEKINGFVKIHEGTPSLHPLKLTDYFIVDNRKTKGYFASPTEMIVSLTQGDIGAYPHEMINDKLTTFGVYDFDRQQVTQFFGSYPAEILEAKGNYPKEFQIPFYLLHENRFIVGFPLSNELIVYDVNDFQNYHTVKADSDFFNFPPPFKDRKDRSEVFKLFYYANQYGALSYHKDLDIFSRVVVHALPIDTQNVCARTYSLILLDKNLTKIEEIELGNSFQVDWSFVLPTSTGFLASGMCDNYSGEDFFVYNNYIDIVKR
ncbi:MAG: hypothetical protein ACXIT9_06515 [Nitritalea sp.]